MGRYEFQGYRRENGRVGIRNHVVILPLDDLSNAAARSGGQQYQGHAGAAALLRPAAVRRGPRSVLPDADRHRLQSRTWRPASSSASSRSGRGRIVDGIAKTGKPVAGFAIERNGDINTIAAASRKAQEFVQGASEQQRETCSIEELFVSVKCGESDTTSGLASCPTVGNLIDKLDPLGVTSCFGETTELTGAEIVCASRAASPEVADEFMKVVQGLPGQSSSGTRRATCRIRSRPRATSPAA